MSAFQDLGRQHAREVVDLLAAGCTPALVGRTLKIAMARRVLDLKQGGASKADRAEWLASFGQAAKELVSSRAPASSQRAKGTPPPFRGRSDDRQAGVAAACLSTFPRAAATSGGTEKDSKNA